jgi:6-phosphogluconolactonase
VNTVDTCCSNPVHLAGDPTGRWLAVARLAPPGSVTSLPIRADGSLGPVASVLELPGTPGPHKTALLGPNTDGPAPDGRRNGVPGRSVP